MEFQSFTISKKKEVPVINHVAEEDEGDQNRDYLVSVDTAGFIGTKKTEKKCKPVIPVINSNNWRTQHLHNRDELDIKAVNEIIAEAKEGQAITYTQTTVAIPLLMRNRPPAGYETEDKLDVSLRPDETDEADYEKMAIEDYGYAMLRGMGWKDGEGLGKDKKLIPTIDAVARPKGLGLGADTRKPHHKDDVSRQNTEEELVLAKGSRCCINSGAHKGRYGKVEGLDEDNARVFVRLAIGDQLITVSQYALKLVSKSEYSHSGLIVNQSKVDDYNKKQQTIDNSIHSSNQASDRINSDSQSSANRSKDHHSTSKQQKKHKKHHREFSSESHETDTKYQKRNTSEVSWLRPELKVRIIDRSFQNDRYFNEKVVIEDVVVPTECTCRLESGKILEGLKQDMLETVIPRSQLACVCVIRGKYRGQLGKIIEKDKSSLRASIQLFHDRNIIVSMDFDDICEFTGRTDLMC